MDIFNPTLYTTAGIFAVLVLCVVTAVFVVSRIKKDNSVMDIFYGPVFAISYWGTWFLTGMPNGVPVLVGILLTLWAVRLGVRIARKNWHKPEDPRYAAWREAWSERGRLYFILRSYLQVNLLQGVIICIVATPLWWVLAAPALETHWLWYLGATVMVLGLVYESIADWQLDAFIAQKKAGTTDKTLLTEGLFRYSRRPNYFGEATIWWGFALIALSSGAYAWPVLVGPLLITYILHSVTGPMLERSFLEKYPEAYARYQAQTNYLIPGRPRT